MKRKRNYLYAILAIAFTLLLFNFGSYALLWVSVLVARNRYGDSGDTMAIQFFNEHLNLYSTILYTVAFVLFALWYYLAVVKKRTRGTGFQGRKRVGISGVGWIALLALAVQHLTTIVFVIIGLMAPGLMEAYSNLVDSSGLTDYSVMWALCTVILPPLTEEMIFRGLVLGYLQRAGMPFFAANLIQAVFFGVFHMNVVQGIYAALLGLLLGYLGSRYRTLAAPVAMHFFYNLFGTALSDLEVRLLPEGVQAALILLSVPAAAVILTVIHRKTAASKMLLKRRMPEEPGEAGIGEEKETKK